ncbi:polar amino acid transport system substrate-binding protein [Neorhizobium galegae]|uniref:substrate-binding periplasmic protein n=1 Tax=Neorhizobium galegae TaxID=399 RepID=UPI001FD9C64B|nr:transporter substrate-binding domain-containing protein [Neorhizobium galegae]MBP2548878.1 polar amino acid transport system substrate-binding protein [Neorhizobium galegae]
MRFLIAIICMVGSPACAASIAFTTESYPPFSFLKDGVPAGAGVEQVSRMMMEAGSDMHFTIEVLPWARALALAETQPDHCVFATARTPERENRFKWVGPMQMDRNSLVRRAGSAVHVPNLAAAKAYRIGTQRDDYTEALLQQKGFTGIDLSASFDLTLAKLLGGRIDLMPMSQPVMKKLLKEQQPIEPVVELSQQELAIACNKSVANALIARMQTALDRLKANGTVDRIYRAYGVELVH